MGCATQAAWRALGGHPHRARYRQGNSTSSVLAGHLEKSHMVLDAGSPILAYMPNKYLPFWMAGCQADPSASIQAACATRL